MNNRKKRYFLITARFDRKNPITGEIEKNMLRDLRVSADTKSEATLEFMRQMIENEPTRLGIKSLKVDEIK